MNTLQKAIRCGGLTFMTGIAAALAATANLNGEGIFAAVGIAFIGGFLAFAAVETGD